MAGSVKTGIGSTVILKVVLVPIHEVGKGPVDVTVNKPVIAVAPALVAKNEGTFETGGGPAIPIAGFELLQLKVVPVTLLPKFTMFVKSPAHKV